MSRVSVNGDAAQRRADLPTTNSANMTRQSVAR